ncbi:hypothetical protein [Microbacterium sp.]|uniref:hypothetical protein n=1 Tax=Microbacterium sp. TaxID=51671 RepID=UPI002FE1F9C3
MTRPLLLDLFCCEGGAAKGYADAGFDVVGVDIQPQPRYPFEHVVADAIELLERLLEGGEVAGHTLKDLAAIHASPPCQAYSVTRHSHDKDHPELIEPTRGLLQATGLPYVIENVEGARDRMVEPMLLCGSMFGLKAFDVDGTRLALRRHRLFESNVWLMSAGGCVHDGDQVAGVYGGGRHRNVSDRDNPARRGGYTPLGKVRAELMGMGWASQHGLSQAIPPAYTEHIGGQLLAHIQERRAA